MKCLVGIESDAASVFIEIFKAAEKINQTVIVDFNVVLLANLAPELIVCDIDQLVIDPLEFLRRIRFVLPTCVIAVYSSILTDAWGASCHLAGASCMLAKGSNAAVLANGLEISLRTGCYTDIQFQRNV